MATKRPRFGFGPLTAVDPLEADMNRMVDLTGETTMAAGPSMVDFLPRLGERAAAAPQAYKPSFMEMFDAVAGGDTITDARKRLIAEDQATQDAAISRAQIQKLMESVLTNPREQLAFLANKPEWAKAVSTNVGAANVGGGDTRVMPGFGKFSAPEVIESGDSIISATPGGGMDVLGVREPSFKEKNEVDIKQRLADIQEMLGGAKAGRMSVQNANDSARVGIAAKKAAGKPAAGGGGSSGALDAIAAELRRRGKL